MHQPDETTTEPGQESFRKLNDRAELEAVFERLTLETMRLVSAGLAMVFGIFLAFNLLDLPSRAVVPVATSDMVLILLFLAINRLLARDLIAPRWAHALGLVITLLVLSNILLTMALLAEPFYTLYVMVLLVGVGGLMLSRRWIAITTGSVIIAWTAVATRFIEGPEMVHYGFTLVAASALAWMLYAARSHTLRRLESLRMQSDSKTRDLEREMAIRHEAEARIRLSDEILGRVGNLVLVADQTGNITYVSPSITPILGYSPDEVLGQGWLELTREDAEIRDQERGYLAEAAADVDSARSEPYERRVLTKDGGERWILWRDTPGPAGTLIGIGTDVTGRIAVDRLTGLPNRNQLIDSLRQNAERAEHPETASTQLLSIDLDRFKLLNESLGFMTGDKILVQLGRRLEECIELSKIRSETLLARMSGDEFAILIEETEHESDGIRLADRILERMSFPFEIDDEAVFLTASIGIAISSGSTASRQDIQPNAETALDLAKEKGGGSYELFDAAIHSRALRRWSLERKLRNALAWNELHLAFQPIVSVADSKISGFEALARWTLPSGENVPPDEFVSVAEEMGLIHQLGEWALRDACGSLNCWRNAGHSLFKPGVSVNLSPYEIDEKLTDRVSRLLTEAKIEPSDLTLEITESVLIEEADRAISILSELRSMGINLALDDFGTGYSSLSNLHRLPVTSVKIDRSFVRAMEPGRPSKMVESIVILARNLDLEIVAEGVETLDQYHQLRDLGCDFVQGYLFSPPVPSTEATALLSRSLTIHQDFDPAQANSDFPT